MPKREEVDRWFNKFASPVKTTMLKVRETLLNDPRIDEGIKWSCPTFMYNGNMASINPRSKQHVSIMFHTGAEIPGKHPLLLGGGRTARFVNIVDEEDLRVKASALTAIVRAWCKLKDEAVGKGSATKTKPKTSKRKPTPSAPAAKASAKKSKAKTLVGKPPTKTAKKKARAKTPTKRRARAKSSPG